MLILLFYGAWKAELMSALEYGSAVIMAIVINTTARSGIQSYDLSHSDEAWCYPGPLRPAML